MTHPPSQAAILQYWTISMQTRLESKS